MPLIFESKNVKYKFSIGDESTSEDSYEIDKLTEYEEITFQESEDSYDSLEELYYEIDNNMIYLEKEIEEQKEDVFIFHMEINDNE